eukprot:CAMPEP_0185161628 /NCGR_PEP_ID=MMETSP1139-20130426/5274_1 /TAXON_ID=298111 /ORGANISM="Pavlova sp., Strain CCMP459" /LENGTH=64 /DNA_ID=CAMNT_0027726905 /DNA_START=552 /DNA_END=746 /DNA_ORIENTATION=-
MVSELTWPILEAFFLFLCVLAVSRCCLLARRRRTLPPAVTFMRLATAERTLAPFFFVLFTAPRI